MVVDAAEAGEFHVYAVESIGQAMAALTGLEAGEPDGDGRYPEDSVNGRVGARLEALARRWKAFIPRSD